MVTGAALEVTEALGQSRRTLDLADLHTTNAVDREILYFGNWAEIKDQRGRACRRSDTPYHACELAFTGSTVRWLGSKGPDHGFFERTRPGPGRIHTLRIVVRRERNPGATLSRAGPTLLRCESYWHTSCGASYRDGSVCINAKVRTLLPRASLAAPFPKFAQVA